MQTKTTHKSGEFTLFDDAGNSHRVIEYTTVASFRPQGSKLTTKVYPSGVKYQLPDGRSVIKINDTEFEVAGTKQKLHKRRPETKQEV
jgi:hypothetical protein